MMACREVTELASQHLDGELPLGKRVAFRLHVMMCRHCRRYLRQLRATIVLLGTIGSAGAAVSPPPGQPTADELAATLAALPPDGDDSG